MLRAVADSREILCAFRFRADGIPFFPYASESITQVFGMSPEELARDATPLIERLHPNDVERIRAAVTASIDVLTPLRGSFRVRHPERGVIWTEAQFIPQRDPGMGVTWHGFLRIADAAGAAPRHEERLRTIQEALPDGLIILRAVRSEDRITDFTYDYVNPGAERLLARTGLTGRRLLDAFPAMRGHSFFDQLAQVVETGKPLDSELPYHSDGLDSWFHHSGVKHNDGLILLFQDVAPRKAAELALRTSEERLQVALSAARMGVWEWDLQTNAVYWSPKCHEILGVDTFDGTFEAFLKLVHPDDSAQMQAKVQEVLSQKTTFEMEFRIVHPNKDAIWVFSHGRTTYTDAGLPAQMIGTVQGITERKNTEKALRDSHHLLQTVIDLVPHFLFAKDRDSRHLFVNRACAQASGMAPEQMIGLCDRDFVPDAVQAENFMRDDRSVIDGGVPKLVPEERLTNALGQTRILRTLKIPFTDPATGGPALLGVSEDITELKRAELALRETSELFRATFDLAAVGMAQADPRSGRLLRVNARLCAITGYTPDELTSKRFSEITHPDDRLADWEMFQRLVRGETGDYRMEKRYLRKDGTLAWVNVNVTLLRDAEGRPLRTVAAIEDITERKYAEDALRESEHKYRRLLENIPQVIFLKDTRSNYVSCNENYARLLNIDARDIEGRSDYDFFPEDLAEKYRADDREIVASGSTKSIVERIVLEGLETWINTVKTPVRNEEGTVTGLLGIFWDISEQKRAEEALLSSETRFRVIFEGAALGMALVDMQGYCVKSNPALHAMLGYSEDELARMTFAEFTHPDDVAADQELFDALMHGRRERYDITKRYVCKNGRLMWGMLSVSMVHASGDERPFAIKMVEDITARKRTEDERARLVMAIEHTAEAIVVTDPDGIIEYVNPAFEQITGYTRNEVLGKKPNILNSGKQDSDFYASMWETITCGEVWSGQIVNKKKNGALYEEETTISPVLDAAGKIVCYVAVKRDVSDHLALERRLRQAQKMEAIGTLAGGIAHDFNNILTSIVGYSEMAASEVEPDSHVRKDLDTVLGAARRASDLVRQILTFSRRVDEQRQPLALGLIINEAMKLLRPSLPSTIEIETTIEKGSDLVLADPSQMHQVLMNLCTNAYHSMQDSGGVLTVDLATTQVDAQLAESHPGLSEGEYVCLTVSDTGCGMTKEVQERVFEPFFTTKDQGEGTGLGLATVHGIVTAHGGDILVYSEPGAGTTFHVYLPCLKRGEPQIAPPEETVCEGTECILLVDDEQAVVALEEKTLRQFGYRVVAFTSSVKALAAFKGQPDRFDVVVTDQTMPKMTGDQLAREIKQIRPEIPVIVTTGFVGEALKQRLEGIGIAHILPKPSRRIAIAALVRKALDELQVE